MENENYSQKLAITIKNTIIHSHKLHYVKRLILGIKLFIKIYSKSPVSNINLISLSRKVFRTFSNNQLSIFYGILITQYQRILSKANWIK